MNKEPRYDKHSKTISLNWDFSPYQFPGLKYSDLQIKLRATRKAWLQALDSLDFDTLTFADVKPFLSRNRKQAVETLAELAAEDPDHFSHSFLNCVIATKARDGVAWLKRNKISRLAMKLNHCLRVMRKANRSEWPTYFRKFHKIYFAM